MKNLGVPLEPIDKMSQYQVLQFSEIYNVPGKMQWITKISPVKFLDNIFCQQKVSFCLIY